MLLIHGARGVLAQAGSAVALELPLGLLAQILAIHEEEHASRPAVLDEPIDRRDRRDRLARPRRHLDQRPRAVALNECSRLVTASIWFGYSVPGSSGGIVWRRARNDSVSAAIHSARVSGRWMCGRFVEIARVFGSWSRPLMKRVSTPVLR
jgi:hypothetical protein